MTATYKIVKTPQNLIEINTPKYYIVFVCGGVQDYEYTRRSKCFYGCVEDAVKAGKRYLRKMKKNGFDVRDGKVCDA